MKRTNGLLSNSSSLLRLYLIALIFGAIFISLNYLLLPEVDIYAIVRAFAGEEYARIQLPEFRMHHILLTVHILASLGFTLCAAYTLIPMFWSLRSPGHKLIGYVFGIFAVTMVMSGIIISYRLPFSGLRGVVPNVIFGLALIWFYLVAVIHARERRWREHQVNIIRAVFVGLGIVLARLYLYVLVNIFSMQSREAVYWIFWLGSGTNLLIAQMVIIWLQNNSRLKRNLAPTLVPYLSKKSFKRK
ncbi:hypothetical protein MSP8887_00553 [Marinomonas spartinae]|uniref:DUF2306 domain-containing protein n=1 Tax=Marinomonas spartinae TaxID=1792290 RepID=UPI000808ED97|nr:DUF2306 domain-containing protein [Marinomonas spartinae]SBS27155.1 hypothetical protein MSP8887_00553 [Marinomonas spartinae]